MYQIQCLKCKTIIDSFSVSCDHVSFRTDYKVIDGMILKEDREYFTGNAINIIFTCPECGEVVTKVDECPSISDFGKNIDSDMINIDWDFVRQGHMNFGILKS